jgi:hypothetical protein
MAQIFRSNLKIGVFSTQCRVVSPGRLFQQHRPEVDVRDYQADALKLALILAAFCLSANPRERHK